MVRSLGSRMVPASSSLSIMAGASVACVVPSSPSAAHESAEKRVTGGTTATPTAIATISSPTPPRWWNCWDEE